MTPYLCMAHCFSDEVFVAADVVSCKPNCKLSKVLFIFHSVPASPPQNSLCLGFESDSVYIPQGHGLAASAIFATSGKKQTLQF